MAAGVARVETYRYIRQLLDRKFLHTIPGRPTRFKAVPISGLIDRFEREENERFRAAQSQFESVRTQVREYGFQYPESEIGPRLRLVQGHAAWEAVSMRISTAQKWVITAVPDASLTRIVKSAFMTSFESAGARGVPVQLLTHLSRADAASVRRLARVLEVRHTSAPLLAPSTVVDGVWSSLLVSDVNVAQQAPDKTVVIVSTATSFVRAIESYLQGQLARSIRGEDRLRELERASGPVAGEIMPTVASSRRLR